MPTPFNSSSTTYFVQSGINSIDALLTEYYNSNSGGKWGGSLGTGANLTYSFPWANGINPTFSTNYGDEPNATYRFGLNTNQQQAARDALTQWSNVANLIFNEVSDNSQVVGDFRFAFTSALGETSWGHASYPNSYWPSAADVWINSDIGSSLDWSKGTYNFKALMHEIGHGLGLKHSGNYNGYEIGNQAGPFLPTEIENRLHTIMSYNVVPNNLWVSYTQSENRWSWKSENIQPETPMLYDIQAIQYMYGPNYSFNSGVTSYSFDSVKPFYQTIWDGGGIDTISISNFNTNCTIDLNPGAFSSLKFTAQTGPLNVNWPSPPAKSTYDGTNNLAIAYNCWIENAIGGSGSDKIYGNDLNNSLDGGNGDDYLVGGKGNDTFDDNIDSRSGNDTFIGGTGNDIYCLSGNDIIIENLNEGTDTVWVPDNYTLGNHIENIVVYSNLTTGLTLTGNTLANYIRGGGGNDTIDGGGGDDTIDGRLGNDTFILDCLRSQCSGTLFNNTYSLTTDFASYSLVNIEFLRFLDSTIAISEILDTIPPSIAISTNQSTLKIGETAIISFTLSEASTNFVLSDVTSSGGTLSNFSGSGTSYTALFTPTTNSTTNGVVSVSSTKFTDAAGNANADGLDGNNTVSMSVDTTPPTINIGSNKSTLSLGETTFIIFTLSEASTNFALGDVTASGGTLSNFRGTSTIYSALFTPTTNSISNAVVSVTSGRFTDAAGNNNTASSILSIAVDTIPPTIALRTNESALRIGETATISFTLSEASTNFTLGDVTASGGSLSNFSGSGTTYSATFTPTPNSTINGVVSVTSGRFTDAAGNNNADENDTNNTVAMTVDTLPPVLLSVSDSNGASDIALNSNISITFNEPIKSAVGTVNLYNLTTNKLIQTFDLAKALNVTASDSTITINPTKDFAYNTTYYLQVSSAQDLSGNSMALTTETFTSTNTYTTVANKYTLSTTPNNLIYSGSNNFTGTGNKNDNIITGNIGNDILDGAAGADRLIGGAGNDTYVIDNNGDVITENSNEGIDTLRVNIGTAGGTYSLTDNLENAILVNKVAFSLSGNGLNNVLTGNAAANIIVGNDGNDMLIGGDGNDILTGGLGQDAFIFKTKLDVKKNLDTITDFISGSDEIQLSKSIFKAIANIGDLSNTAFYSAANAVKGSDADDRIIYNTSTGALYYDADGNGKAAAVQFVTLTGNPNLEFSDFIIV